MKLYGKVWLIKIVSELFEPGAVLDFFFFLLLLLFSFSVNLRMPAAVAAAAAAVAAVLTVDEHLVVRSPLLVQ
jgi:hypothetical protein